MSAAASNDEPTDAAAFPWDDAIALAFGRLQIAPRDFWQMTPRELALILAPLSERAPGGPPSRMRMNQLLQLYPDRR